MVFFHHMCGFKNSGEFLNTQYVFYGTQGYKATGWGNGSGL